MNAVAKTIEQAVQTQVVELDSTGLPVIVGTLPEAIKSDAEVRSEAAAYEATVKLMKANARLVIASVVELEKATKKAAKNWWHVLHSLATRCEPGNGQQFGREYDMVRQEVLDSLEFKAPASAETIAAKWAELSKSHVGYGTFANYASRTRKWVEGVKASVDPNQSPESFALSVQMYYEAQNKAKSTGTSGKAAGHVEQTGTESAGTVKTSEPGLTATVGAASVTLGTKTITFPQTVMDGIARAGREVAGMLEGDDKHPPVNPEAIKQAYIGFCLILAEIEQGTALQDITEACQAAAAMIRACNEENPQVAKPAKIVRK